MKIVTPNIFPSSNGKKNSTWLSNEMIYYNMAKQIGNNDKINRYPPFEDFTFFIILSFILVFFWDILIKDVCRSLNQFHWKYIINLVYNIKFFTITTLSHFLVSLSYLSTDLKHRFLFKELQINCYLESNLYYNMRNIYRLLIV